MLDLSLLPDGGVGWLEASGDHPDIVISTRIRLARNLEAWEIVEQVRALRADLPSGARVHGVVFQGISEPLANVERVIQAIRVLGNPSALAIDWNDEVLAKAVLTHAGEIRNEAARKALGG